MIFFLCLQLPTMAAYISFLDVSLDKDDEQSLQNQGFKKIPGNLNQGTGGNAIYLWYKCGPAPVTRLQASFNDDMSDGLVNAGYTKIPKDLNTGAGGDCIYLWYFRGSGEYHTPIVKIEVTTNVESEAQKFISDWERLGCDLNRQNGGNWIHLWMKREKQTYICDVTATDSYGSDTDLFLDGYIRVDEDANRGTGRAPAFIWYRQTTDPKRALTELNISTDEDQRQVLQAQGYKHVNVNLNKGTIGNSVYLWFKQDKVNNPIKAIALLVSTDAFGTYSDAGATVIKRSLNTGNNGRTEFLSVNQ